MKPAEKVLFLYHVKHPVHGEIEAEAEDRLRAVAAAGRAWGVPWTTIARDCNTHNGTVYLCKGDMIPCVWEPGSAGLWQWEAVE